MSDEILIKKSTRTKVMSAVVVNSTSPFDSIENDFGGLDIRGFEGQENSLNGSDGNDLVIGGDLNDVLFSLEGDDTIEGGAGNDIIFGGAGQDVLIGGKGKDKFIFDRDAATISGENEIDIIEDFNPEEDSLTIRGLNVGDRIDYDRQSGILSINDNEFVDIGTDFDFQDLNFESDGVSGNEVLALDGGNVFSLDSGIVVSEDAILNKDDASELPIENDDFGLM